MFITPTPPTIRPTLDTAIMKMKRPLVSESQRRGQKIRAGDEEVIVLLHAQAAVHAEQLANLLGDDLLVPGIVVFHHEPVFLDLRMNLAKGFKREVSGIVLRVASAAEGLGGRKVKRADDGKDVALDVDILANGIAVRKQVFGGVMAQHNNIAARCSSPSVQMRPAVRFTFCTSLIAVVSP